jgi:hypothetical protein
MRRYITPLPNTPSVRGALFKNAGTTLPVCVCVCVMLRHMQYICVVGTVKKITAKEFESS